MCPCAMGCREAKQGRINALPVSSVAPPEVARVEFENSNVTVAATTGGTAVLVTGRNFGVFAEVVVVSAALPHGDQLFQNCTFVVVDVQLRWVVSTCQCLLRLWRLGWDPGA